MKQRVSDLAIQTPWQAPWVPEFVGTLIFLVHQGEVLLIHKKTGHGAGKINGPGGKLDPGETVAECAARELYEEVGLTVHDLRCRAEMRFVEEAGPQWLGFAFTGTEFSGQLVETAEATPFWCAIEEIPYQRMWPDDAIWLPKILAQPPSSEGDVYVADYLFNDGALLEHQDSGDASVWRALTWS